MKKLISILVFICFANQVFPCTTFVLFDINGNFIFGRNLDFPIGLGHIQINKRNLEKVAFINPIEKPIKWISKYGSITFNQAGKEFPYGGINEAGLVIEQMWLQDTKYPDIDSRFGLSELQWVQYQLDNSATIQDVINSDTLVRISFTSVASLHFLIADTNGNIATIEYLDGKMVVHTKDNLPYTVLANDTYDNSINYKSELENNNGEHSEKWTKSSLDRFSRAAMMIKEYDSEKILVDYSFDILKSVAADGEYTKWSIVYDPINKIIHYKTNANQDVRILNLNDFDYSCESKNIFIDIDSTRNGIDNFIEYNFEDNYKLMETLFSSMDFINKNMPKEAMYMMAKYPETLKCKQ
ncbi:MAG: linear amide C-N hydrolase [Ignavibacteriales bacterium]|nr:linear amide C-N hydrolase [Ignavibacteriales bacterium]